MVNSYNFFYSQRQQLKFENATAAANFAPPKFIAIIRRDSRTNWPPAELTNGRKDIWTHSDKMTPNCPWNDGVVTTSFSAADDDDDASW